MPVIPAIGATASYILYASAAASVISAAAGTGLGMYSQNQQAQNAQRTSAYNAAIMQQNADVQARMVQYQANIDRQTAMAQYDAQQKNAAAIEAQAGAIEAQGRERARRAREEQDRMLSLQRAKYAKAGVVNEGSPLVVLADQARLTELNVQDAAYETNLDRSATLRKADLERYQSGFSLLDAGLADYRSRAQDASRRIAYRQADLTKAAGASQAASYRAAAGASLISGVGNIASTGYKFASIT